MPPTGDAQAIFLATSNVTFVDVGWYLGLGDACDLDFYLHSGPTDSGPWTVLYAESINYGPGTEFQMSGLVNVPMVAGTYYATGVGWNCSATYFGDYSGWGGQYPIGEYLQSYWDNSYPGFSPNYAPPNNGNNPGLAYYGVFGFR